MGILIAGMHRSGTSALSRFVGLLTGFDGVAGAAFDNEEGHWEDPRLNRALEAGLIAVDADWASPPLRPLDLSRPELAGVAADVRTVLDDLGSGPWVLKDPRLSLALESVVGLLEQPTAVVCTYRDPLEVARSVHTRDGYEPEYGLALWEIYTRAMVLGAVGVADRTPIAWASYDRLLRDPEGLARRLDEMVRGAGMTTARDGTARAPSGINRALRHQHGTDPGPELSPQQSTLLALVREADEMDATPAAADVPPLTPWARALIETRRPYARMDRDNRLLVHRLRRVQPAYRLADRVRRGLGRPVPTDPFDRYR